MGSKVFKIIFTALGIMLALICIGGAFMIVGDMLRITMENGTIPPIKAVVALLLSMVAFVVLCLIPERIAG